MLIRIAECWECQVSWVFEVEKHPYTQNLSGEKKSYCPHCGAIANIYSRIYNMTEEKMLDTNIFK